MSAVVGYIILGIAYLFLVCAMAAVVGEAWCEDRERECARQRRSAGDMYVSKEGM